MLEKKIKLDIAYLVSITHNNIVFGGLRASRHANRDQAYKAKR